MTRNWYAVYTRPQRERKVVASLTKKGIKNYFPINNIVVSNTNHNKFVKEPLISSFVFVYINDAEIEFVKKVPGVVNFLYWMSKPAVIKQEEIEAVKQLTSFYHNIRLEKSAVNMNDTVRIIDEPIISFKEKSASVKFQTLKMVMPSMGYTMIAERDKVNEVVLEQELTQASFLPKKLNSFFSN
jgi:transcription antitermination factor NusG